MVLFGLYLSKNKLKKYLKKVLQCQLNVIGIISHIEYVSFEIILFIAKISKVVPIDDVLYAVAILSGGIVEYIYIYLFRAFFKLQIVQNITPNTA